MSRRRYVSTDISDDDAVAELVRRKGYLAALFYTWLIPHADDQGTLPAQTPKKLLSIVMPQLALLQGNRRVKDAELGDALDEMVDLELLEREEDGTYYFPPDSFYRYQTYIPESKRRFSALSGVRRRSAALSGDSVTPSNVSFSPSPSVSSSPSPSLSARAQDDGVPGFVLKTDPPWPDDTPPSETYAGRFVREHQVRNAGNPPSSVEQADAKRLEREFGSAACIELAEDFGWQKGPAYLRKVLNDPDRRQNGTTRTNGAHAGQPRRAAGANGSERPSDANKRLGIGVRR